MADEFPYRKKVGMQFGYSSTAVPTILSGESPEKHGHFSFFYLDKERSPFRIFSFLPFGGSAKSFFNRGRVRSLISRIFGKLAGYTGYFQLYNMPFNRLKYFNYCEKKDIFVRDGLAPECTNLADALAAIPALKYHISDWRLGDAANLAEAERLMREGDTDFYFVYTASLDSFLHEHISEPEAIKQRLDGFEKDLRRMLSVLKESGRDFSFTVFSDHGMTPLKGVSDAKNAIRKLNLKFGSDYVACYDSTMARFYFFNDDAKALVFKTLSAPEYRGHFLSAAEKASFGIRFPHNKYGDEIFLTDPGVQIAPSDMGRKPLNGMHGFSPLDPDSAAAAISTDDVLDGIESLKDYFALMTRTARILAEKKDGK